MAEREIKVIQDLQDLKHLFVEEQERDKNGLAIPSLNTILAQASVLINVNQLNIPSDNVAPAKEILSYTLAAGASFVVTKIKVGCNAESVITLAVGVDLASLVSVDSFYLSAKGMWEELSEGNTPIAVITNATTSNTKIWIVAGTGTIMGVANNPAAGAHLYLATLQGFLAP